jgi:quercetin dioxygenase-like cupin family protein
VDAYDYERWRGYEEALPWHHRQPFGLGAEQFPCVIRREDADYFSWAPEPGNSMATWVYVGTRRLNQGTFYVEPGHWFDAGNHPNPEPYYVLRGSLLLSNPDTSDVIEITAGDAANIPAYAFHHAWNAGTETCEILWWVPGEMHTDEFKEAISTKEHGEWQWYPRQAVMLEGRQDRNEGFPSHLDDMRRWPPAQSTKVDGVDMEHLPPSSWLRLMRGQDPRLTIPVSFFYCDEQIRVGQIRILAGRESEPVAGGYEATFYVESGSLSVNLTGTGRSLLAGPSDVVFLPPDTAHTLQAIGDEPVVTLFAQALPA